MPREFKTQFMVSVGITLALLVVICTLLFYLQSDVAAKSSQIAEINHEIVDKNSALKNLSDLEQQQPTALPFLNNMNAVIPSEDMLFSVQHNLQTIAQNNNLAFSSEFGSETPPTAGSPGIVIIEMTLQGSYANIIAFLGGAESSNFVSVASIDLVEEPTGGNFSAIVTGSIPFHT